MIADKQAHPECSGSQPHNMTSAIEALEKSAAISAPSLGLAPAEDPQQMNSSSMQAASEHQHAGVIAASYGYTMDRRMAPPSAGESAEHGDQAQSRPGEHRQDTEPDHAAEEVEDEDQAGRRVEKQKQANKSGRKPARNRACPCGSAHRYKDCCGPIQAAVERRAMHGAQTPGSSQEYKTCMPQLYI